MKKGVVIIHCTLHVSKGNKIHCFIEKKTVFASSINFRPVKSFSYEKTSCTSYLYIKKYITFKTKIRFIQFTGFDSMNPFDGNIFHLINDSLT